MAAYNSVRCVVGHYNWLNPTVKEVQVLFSWRDGAPVEVSRVTGRVVWDEGEGPSHFDSALDAVIEIQKYNKGFVASGETKWLQSAREYLESMYDHDQLDMLLEHRQKLLNRLAETERDIAEIEKRLSTEIGQ